MNKILRNFFLVNLVLTVAASGFIVILLIDSNSTKLSLAQEKATLASTGEQFRQTESRLQSVTTQLITTQEEFDKAQQELESVRMYYDLVLDRYTNLMEEINFRHPTTIKDRQRYITPSNLAINGTVVSAWGVPSSKPENVWRVYESMFQWMVANINYSPDAHDPILPPSPLAQATWINDSWKRPVETLGDKAGDCEDMAALLASLMVNYNQGKYRAWLIEISGETPYPGIKDDSAPGNTGFTNHVAVAFRVEGGRLAILDPSGRYFTGITQERSLISDNASNALNRWLSHWSGKITNAHVVNVVSSNESHEFSSNAEFLNWVKQRDAVTPVLPRRGTG